MILNLKVASNIYFYLIFDFVFIINRSIFCSNHACSIEACSSRGNRCLFGVYRYKLEIEMNNYLDYRDPFCAPHRIRTFYDREYIEIK